MSICAPDQPTLEMWIATANAMYQRELFRAPDPSGLANWLDLAGQGQDADQILTWMRTTPEWHEKHDIPPVPPLPPVPTRDQVCSIRTSFQGLTVQTYQFGSLPWFGAALSWLDPEDRQAVYVAKKAVGDTHCEVILSGSYTEPNQAYQNIPGVDLSGNLPALVALVAEILAHGFTPMLFLAGDGQSNPDGGYNDPVGMTYGHDWLMRHLPSVVTALQGGPTDLAQHVLFIPGFDGVFYGWEPEQVAAFGALFRQLLPNGYLGIEHNTGHLPVGNGPADYAPSGPMQAYDVILSEFDKPLGQDSTWQVAARMLGPAYNRPADQPAGDDPPPAPFYLAAGTPRGKFYTCGFEFLTYWWVRSQVTVVEVAAARQSLRNLGYQWVG